MQSNSTEVATKSEVQPYVDGYSRKAYLKFILPSLMGAMLFLAPIYYKGKVTIGIGVLAEFFQGVFDGYLHIFMTCVMVLSVLGVIYAQVVKPKWVMRSSFFSSLFIINSFWMAVRSLGAIFAVLTLFEFGPEWIYGGSTGGTVLYSLIPVLTTWFLFAGLLMPLILEFGLMEFIGSIFRKVMKPLFKLPGRSSIDAFASWMGSGTVGVLITTRQYEEGFYTKREAAVISTTFSVASVAFSLVVITFIGLEDMFVQFYSAVIIGGLVAAVICPRIPPLSLKKDEYYEPVGKQISEAVPEHTSNFKWGVQKAVEKAESVPSYGSVAVKGLKNVLDIWFGLLPLVMALGTIALVIAEFTPFFTYLSYPIVGLLNLLQIPAAAEAAPAMLVGFADMFLPAVIGSGIENELSRFVIAAVSMTQLIYMSEVGVLLMKSKIPVTFLDLIIIFLQRTIITLPIIAWLAHTFFF
ncbi:YjiH family protein [Pontibacillus halophilus]|uniref:YjiH family protein n=1 Tax=Pontibacillus halophilus TaxID=516704 RepID=UPI00040A4479